MQDIFHSLASDYSVTIAAPDSAPLRDGSDDIAVKALNLAEFMSALSALALCNDAVPSVKAAFFIWGVAEGVHGGMQ
jgi:hypothetical protein